MVFFFLVLHIYTVTLALSERTGFKYTLFNKKLKISWLAEMGVHNMTWTKSKVIKKTGTGILMPQCHFLIKEAWIYSKKILCGVHNRQNGTGRVFPCCEYFGFALPLIIPPMPHTIYHFLSGPTHTTTIFSQVSPFAFHLWNAP
jgi:hypothetical protein